MRKGDIRDVIRHDDVRNTNEEKLNHKIRNKIKNGTEQKKCLEPKK